MIFSILGSLLGRDAALDRVFWKPRGHSLKTSDASLTVEEMLTILRDWEKETTIPPKLSVDDLARFRKEIYVLIYKETSENTVLAA